MKWQPIETAPKDGKRVLLWDGDAELPVFGRYGPFTEDPFELEPYDWAAENYGHDGSEGKVSPTYWATIEPPTED